MEQQNGFSEGRCAQAVPFLKPIVTSNKKDGTAVHPAPPSSTAVPCSGVDEDPEMVAAEIEEDLGSGEPVSPTSMMFHEPRIHGTILVVMGTSKRIDVNNAKQALEATVVRHPRFSSIQVWDGDKAKWVRTILNVDNHVIVPKLNPATILSPNLFVEEYLSTLSTTMLDFSKPLWELHILNIPTAEAEATVVFRIHHSIGDGISLISLLVTCCTCSNSNPNNALSPIPRKVSTVRQVKVATTIKIWSWKGLVMWFLGGLAMVWNTMVASFLLLFTWLGWMKDTKIPMNAGKGAAKFSTRKYMNMIVSLEDLRIIKNAADATINDVLLGVVSAGISRYLTRRYGNLGCSFPTNIRLRSAVMVNLRKSLRIQAFPNMMMGAKVKSQWGNRIGFLLIPLPIVQYDHALDYVKSAKVVADRKKSSMEAWLTYFVGILLTKFFGIKIASGMLCQVMSNITVLMSNIPGPTEEIEFYGNHISHIALTVYGVPQALCVHCLSYMNKMKIFLAVDEHVIPDLHQLHKDILESLSDIKDVAIMEGSLK